MKAQNGKATENAASSDTPFESDWAERQQSLGNVPQAVLLRNLPVGVNGLLDAWHRTLLRWSFAAQTPSSDEWIADLGCGYGRMASEAKAMGFENVAGLDYEAGFCRQYQHDFGFAVRGSIAQPPFAENSLSAAYAITAYMYIGLDRATEGLRAIGSSLKPGARILVLEAGAEFNKVSRTILRRKRTQSLAVDGFTCEQLGGTMLPADWRVVASGSNAATTILLPALLFCGRWPRIFKLLSAAALRLDRPRAGLHDRGWRCLCLHRWVLCEKVPTP